MRKWRPDFKNSKVNNNDESWYDLIEDWELIDASFTQQYNIRLGYDKMTWYEFCSKLQLLNEKTPLGQIVSIRSEKDSEILKHFTPEQKRIRNQYRFKKASNLNMNDYNDAMTAFEEMFKSMAKKKKEG